MIALEEVHLALRARAETLVVATTGDSTHLGITAEGFTQTGASFSTQKFRPGMEIVATGSRIDCNNGVHIVRDVAAGLLSIVGGLTPERRPGATRSIVSGLPLGRDYEGTVFTPVIGRPFVVEEFDPSPGQIITTPARNGERYDSGRYRLVWYVLANNDQGMAAARVAGDALAQLFAPGTTFDIASCDLRISNAAPIATQLIAAGSGRMRFTFAPEWRASSRNAAAA